MPALVDPDARFFDSANPGHRDGDMLVCLVPLSMRNILGAIGKAVRRSFAGCRPR